MINKFNKPNYKIGDIVKIVGSLCVHKGMVGTLIKEYKPPEYPNYQKQWVIEIDGKNYSIYENEIEPYNTK